MATGAEILKELFVSLGWQHDEASRKKVVEAEQKTTKELEAEQKKREVIAKKRREDVQATIAGFTKITAAAEAMALGVVAAVERVARGFEQAYNAAARTGSSVKELNAFSYAASQLGSSAEEAQSAVEGLAKAQREMPGYAQMLKGLGATDPNNIVKSLNEIMPRLAAMPYNEAEAYAKRLNIPEHLLNAMHDHIEEFKKFEAESNAKYGILGLDPEKAARDGRALTQLFRGLYDTVQKLVDAIGSKLFGDLKGPIADLNAFLLAHGKEITEAIVAIATALFNMIKGFVEELPRLNEFVKTIGGWNVALTALAAVITASFVSRVANLLTAMIGLSRVAAPAWMLRLLGVGGVAGIAAGAAGAAGVAALQALPEDQKDQILDRHEALQQLRKHRYGGLWNTVKQAAGIDRPSANDQLWLRSTEGQKALKASRRGWNEGSVPGTAGSLTALLDAESARAGIDPKILRGIRAGESLHGSAYDIGDRNDGPAYGPLQLNVGKGRLGDVFQRETGLDLRDPKTIATQVRWVASYIKRRLAANPNYNPGGEWFGYHPWDAFTSRGTKGEAGYVPDRPAPAPSADGDADWRNHRGGKVPIPPIVNKPIHIDPLFGGFDPAKLRATMTAQPLGGSPTDNSKSVTIHQTNHNSVTGVSDPTAAAAQIGARHDKHSSLLVRSMQSAIG